MKRLRTLTLTGVAALLLIAPVKAFCAKDHDHHVEHQWQSTQVRRELTNQILALGSLWAAMIAAARLSARHSPPRVPGGGPGNA